MAREGRLWASSITRFGLALLVDADLGHPAEGRARREHIVVIADNEVRFLCSVELQLEGADLVLFAQFPERARPELSLPCQADPAGRAAWTLP